MGGAAWLAWSVVVRARERLVSALWHELRRERQAGREGVHFVFCEHPTVRCLSAPSGRTGFPQHERLWVFFMRLCVVLRATCSRPVRLLRAHDTHLEPYCGGFSSLPLASLQKYKVTRRAQTRRALATGAQTRRPRRVPSRTQNRRLSSKSKTNVTHTRTRSPIAAHQFIHSPQSRAEQVQLVTGTIVPPTSPRGTDRAAHAQGSPAILLARYSAAPTC